jgi:hypothetical protein
MFAEFRCGIEIPHAERWSSAAAPIFYKRNLEPERFQDSHRSDADMRFVIAHESVVPEEDVAARVVAVIGDRGRVIVAGVIAPGYSVLRKPFIEAFACVMW